MPHGTVEKIYLSDGAPIATFYFPPGAMRAPLRVDDVGIVDRWTDTETRWDAPPECVHRVATTLQPPFSPPPCVPGGEMANREV